MNSMLDNPGMPPMMSPESQSPPWWKVAGANMQTAMNDPKGRIIAAMMAQQLAKGGQGLMGGGAAGQMQGSQPPQFDLYGNLTR